MSFQKLGTKFFGKQLSSLEELVEKSNLPIVYKTYVGQLFFYCFLSFSIFSFYFFYLFMAFWKFDLIFSIISSLILATTITSSIATIFYLYPFYKYNQQSNDIERNMPLGIAYMNIVSKSGVPPEKLFKYVSDSKNFGEFAKECERIHKYVNLVGKDVISSTKEVAFRTPSEKFKEFLLGFVSTILSGSNLNLYLSQESKKGIELYRSTKKKYISLMGFFADIYIVGLLIAPLVMVIVLTAFSLIEPTIFSIEIILVIQFITYLFVPIGGIIFLLTLNSVKV